jgi:phosphoserine phosphatase RsbU/P
VSSIFSDFLREELSERRLKLEALADAGSSEVTRLLCEIDGALARMGAGSYGLCETCHQAIETERLAADPLVRYCLDHLSAADRHALQQDLELAARIQIRLLPQKDLEHGGWQVAYHYEPAGPVSGDYCDLVVPDDHDLYFILGDVSGKGVAASMLMSNLQAMFRALIPIGLPLAQLVKRASRIFCESTLTTHYATLVCGRAGARGDVEICNAGHVPGVLVDGDSVLTLTANGVPLGIFCDSDFSVSRYQVREGGKLLLYSDGISEARNPSEAEYGIGRLLQLARQGHARTARDLVRVCMDDLNAFRNGARQADDVSLMIIGRAHGCG